MIVALLGVALVLPTATEAGVIRVADDEVNPARIIFEAARGETNDVTLTQAGSTFTLIDASAPVTTSDGCVSLDEHTAVCAPESISEVSVRLRDLADLAVIDLASDESVTVWAGGGADWLVIREAETASVIGSGGDDFIKTYAPRSTHAAGGGGDDRFEGGFGFFDVDGGPGRDTIIGGLRGDLLLGGAGADVIRGRRGHDEMRGNRGDDTLVGGSHLDMLSGNRGDDLILARDRARDWIHGGVGHDRARVDRNLDISWWIEVFS